MSRDRASLAMVVTCGALVLAACAPAVRSDRDESIPIPQGATWAWEPTSGPREPEGASAPDTAGGTERPRGMAEPRYSMGGYGRDIPFDDVIFAQRFRRAAEAAMQAKGFHKVDDLSQAEFLLMFNPHRSSRRDTRLVVTFKQRERGEVAWRASYIMDIYDMRESSQASVQKIADKVLRELR